MEKWKTLVRRVDAASDMVGRVASFLLIPLMLIATMEVILRYVFNSPTIWAWDVNVQLFGVLILFGGAYTYRYDEHVRVDLLIVHLPPRGRAILNLITSFLFFFSFTVLLIFSSQEALNAFAIKEQFTSVWSPPVYPLKMLIPLAVFLFILQGVTYVIRDLLIVIHPEGVEK